jgi:hypothetical protein
MKIARMRTFVALALSAMFIVAGSPSAHADEPPTAAPPAGPPSTSAESPSVAPSVSGDANRAPFESRIVDVPSTHRTFPAIGGHLGMALPLATVSTRTTGIGADFVTVGLTPGITVHLDEHWAIDFEFIAFNELKNTPAATTFIVDPGIIRKFDGFVAGLRVATQVGAPTNSGLVPIFVLPFKIGNRAVWFLELDVPLFIRDGGTKAVFSATALFQTGVGF